MAAPVRAGKLLETSFSSMMPAFIGFFGLSGVCYVGTSTLFGQPWPSTFSDEFLAEAHKIGNVMQRGSAPPVYLNPIRSGIPGSIRGPEDLDQVE